MQRRSLRNFMRGRAGFEFPKPPINTDLIPRPITPWNGPPAPNSTLDRRNPQVRTLPVFSGAPSQPWRSVGQQPQRNTRARRQQNVNRRRVQAYGNDPFGRRR